ncbi:MAG: tyrosine-type recombinase/integrase [Bacteroidales bacterium]|nr:tyrosine-type recombinase/integrase [Bacteroidales bacterium]MBQ8049220.1 tyrosine-type recombinase/integrase [Bacteroidales bacterium]
MNAGLCKIEGSHQAGGLPVRDGADYDEVLTSFLNGLDIMETSRETYRWGLVRFFKWIRSSGRSLETLSPADIMSFKNSLMKEKLSPLTIGGYVTAVRMFYSWTETSLLYPNIARSVRPPRGRKGFRKCALSPQESASLLDYLKERSLRDYAIVNLILRTGLRTIEVSRADIGDVVRKRGKRVLKVWGKGADEKDAYVILGQPVWGPIQEYLGQRKASSKTDPLFVTEGKGHKGVRMAPRSIQYLCKEALKAIGLDGHEYSAHSLRHTTGVLILKNGGDWKDVQRVLRHASPATSQIYTASIEEEMRLDSNPEGLLDDAI